MIFKWINERYVELRCQFDDQKSRDLLAEEFGLTESEVNDIITDGESEVLANQKE